MSGVQAFSFYNRFKHYQSGTINLGSTSFAMHLVKSTSNFATKTLSTLGSLTNEVASTGGYKHSGKALAGVLWTAGASAGQEKFSFTATSLSASGTITSILAYVVCAITGASAKDAANKLVGYASLTSGIFAVSSGNKLILNPPAAGLFTLA